MERKIYFCLLLVLSLTIVSLSGCKAQSEQEGIITEEQFKSLLTVQDIENLLVSGVELDVTFFDYKKLAESIDPQQVANMDSFYGLSFQTGGGISGLTFSVIDFDSQTSADNHFEKMKLDTPGLENMALPIGDTSAEVEVNAQGIGSIIAFTLEDRFVSFHTAMPEGESPIVDLSALEELARLVEERLRTV
jgi:hypothetical protein